MSLDFKALNERALPHLEEVLLGLLHLDVDQEGDEFVMLNPLRRDHEHGSFKINATTGLWSDFAAEPGEASGGDVTSLVAYVKNCSQGSAAGTLTKYLDVLDRSTTSPLLQGGDEIQPRVGPKGPKIAAPSQPIEATRPEMAGLRVAAANPTIKPITELASAASPGEAVPLCLPSLKGFGAPTSTHTYLDRAGLPVFAVFRYEAKDRRKEFRPYTLARDEGTTLLRWKVRAPDALLPLYNRDQIATRPEAKVVFCEGEKAADAAALLFPSAVCTTTAFGSKSPAKSDFRPLAGREVLVVPDNDEAGRAYATAVTELALRAGAKMLGLMVFPKHLFGPMVDGVRQDVPAGYDLADALADGWTKERLSEVHAEIIEPLPAAASVNTTARTQVSTKDQVASAASLSRTRPPIPDDFSLTADAVYWKKPDKDGGSRPVWLSSRIEVIALTRSVESDAWGRLVRFSDPDGVSHQWCIPQEMFGSEQGSVWSSLMSMGCNVAAEATVRTQLARYILSCQPPARGRSVKQPGWTGDAFVFPDGTSYGQGEQLISFETRDPLNQAMFVPSGTVADWSESIGRLCIGNSRLALAVCIALSGPTLLLLGAENSGFHFRGRSSIGKTTILRVACSVWGSPSKVMRPWRATANGLEGTASQHNDLLLALDELGESSPHEADAATYMLGNGQGKSRATVTGAPKAIARWRLPFISTGEAGLADHLQRGGITVRAGQEARFVDIEAAPEGGYGLYEQLHGHVGGEELSRVLTAAATRHHGAIGRAFVEYLAHPATRAVAVAQLHASIDDFVQRFVPVDADGQVKRVAHRFALAAAAGELAVSIGLLPWEAGEAMGAARACFSSWVDRRGGTAELERDQACELVRRHLELYGERNFRWLRSDSASASSFTPTTEHHGWKRRSSDGRMQYLITTSAFETVVCRGHDSKSIARHLRSAQVLLPDRQGKNSQSIRVPDLGTSQRLYVISPDLLGEADPPLEPPTTTERQQSAVPFPYQV